MDGQDKGQVGGGLVVEAQNELPIAVVANLSCVPNVLADPGTYKIRKCLKRYFAMPYLNRKVAAWTMNGASIQRAVRVAQRMWSSTKKKNVNKSVKTSAKPKNTLKTVNLNTANILGKGED